MGRVDEWFACIDRNDGDALDAMSRYMHFVNKDGLNGLMVAARDRRVSSLEWCIRHGVGRGGVDKEERKQGWTALMLACQRWQVHLVTGCDHHSEVCAQMLIQAGADPLKKDASGKTCLHHAVAAGLKNLVRFLCMELSEAGALVCAVDSARSTALQCLPGIVDTSSSGKERAGKKQMTAVDKETIESILQKVCGAQAFCHFFLQVPIGCE